MGEPSRSTVRDLISWLRHQIEDDESRANLCAEAFLHGDRHGIERDRMHPSVVRHVYRWTPAHVKDEIAAKRHIVGWCEAVIHDRVIPLPVPPGHLAGDRDALAVTLAVETLKHFAEPYRAALRGGFNDAWRVVDG